VSGLHVHFDGATAECFYVPALLILTLRNFCNDYMRTYGAYDTYGREVIDPQSQGERP
jgi:hypothetical protein